VRSPPQDEISHAVNAVSAQEDNLVDRTQVEAWQQVHDKLQLKLFNL
jgi:surfactin synthase thioesterase subunit